MQYKNRDFLTGFALKDGFYHSLKKLIFKSEHDKKPFSVVLIDLDHFKKINDTLGHQFGDKVLVQFSQLLKSSFSDTDYIFRWGGEEFLVILPDADAEIGLKAAAKFHVQLNEIDFSIPWTLTASIGSTYAKHDKDFNVDKYIQRADEALYRAKESGRNQTIQSHCDH